MKAAFIGCGNMGGAIIQGLISKGIAPENIIAADPMEASRKRAEEQYGIRTTAVNAEAVKGSDIVVLAVKPYIAPKACDEICTELEDEQLVLSIMAGKRMKDLEEMLGGHPKIVRAMPNTPCLIGEGMIGYCASSGVTAEEKETAAGILRAVGLAEEIPEKLMDAVTSVSGSSPAFVFMLIEAMADGAVLEGMPRDMAMRFAAQAVKGSAALVLATGKHPGELKDMVCSPGGTTIEGVRVLEENAFRGTVMQAVMEAAEKSSLL
ncbi:MAG: pyrroline-5-carboxylate reductase [Lachnospiraceae bacterium]|nr:pyrroline-5-carboxylate reductase [Lachnospiraceae bacterium]